MAKNTKSSDVNVTAFEILQEITREQNKSRLAHSVEKAIEEKLAKKKSPPAKNPAAVALGRLGGLKGGKARAKSLSPKKRSEIAQNAALARWK